MIRRGDAYNDRNPVFELNRSAGFTVRRKRRLAKVQDFEALRDGYQQHCGPTAITNLVLLLQDVQEQEESVKAAEESRRNCPFASEEEPSVSFDLKDQNRGKARKEEKKRLKKDAAIRKREIFLEVADIGKRMHVYWNTRLFGFWGGTSDVLTPLYVKRCLRKFDLGSVRVSGMRPASLKQMMACLDRGEILFGQLHMHPKYKNHHVLIYGYDEKGLLVADGWKSKPVHFRNRDLKWASYLRIRP